MLKYVKDYFLLFLLSLLCSACVDNEPSYFPLDNALGWQYDVALITRDGLFNQKYMFNNLGEGELNGKPAFLRQSIDGMLSYYSIEEGRIDYLGHIDTHTVHSEFNQHNSIILPEELSVGVKWQDVTITKLLQKTGPPQKTLLKSLLKYH